MSIPRVLAVDDDTAILRAMSRVLGGVGFDVTTANSFAAGKALLNNGKKFDVVFLDLDLGDGWGADLLQFITGKPRPAAIVLSGQLDAEKSLELADSCDLVLAKPFTGDTLIRAVWRSIHTGRIAASVAAFCRTNGLSPREEQVVLATVEGLSNDETAARLCCTENTLRTHWQRIRNKTQCDTRTAVLAMLLQHALDKRGADN